MITESPGLLLQLPEGVFDPEPETVITHLLFLSIKYHLCFHELFFMGLEQVFQVDGFSLLGRPSPPGFPGSGFLKSVAVTFRFCNNLHMDGTFAVKLPELLKGRLVITLDIERIAMEEAEAVFMKKEMEVLHKRFEAKKNSSL